MHTAAPPALPGVTRHHPVYAAVELDGRALTGITDLLQATFYPDWSYEKAIRVCGYAAPDPHTGQRVSQQKNTPTNSRKRKGRPIKQLRAAQIRGLRRGNRVDQELNRIIDLCQRYPALAPRDFLVKELPPSRLKRRKTPIVVVEPVHWRNEDDKTVFHKLRRCLHSYSRLLINELADLDLVPIASQFPVGNGALGMGTSVDLVCEYRDPQRKPLGVVIIEVKTGYANYYDAHSGNWMRPPFAHCRDSPHYQHQLQLALTTWLYQAEMQRRTGQKPKIGGACVIQLRTESDARLWPLEIPLDDAKIRQHAWNSLYRQREILKENHFLSNL